MTILKEVGALNSNNSKAVMDSSKLIPPPSGPYTPTLIIHGGAGSITRSHLLPPLYASYAASLTSYTQSTNALLHSGASALDAACHAVTLMEDDPLFNCGRGSVFNSAGEIEMEASIMLCSIDPSWEGKGEGSIKRGAAVSLIKGTRHPILLARELLVQGDEEWREVGGMHCQRSGRELEEWGWGRGLEKKGSDWFWTRKRWEEHRRGLKGALAARHNDATSIDGEQHLTNDGMALPSQGTVGCVCMDSWGNLAVATSTGGLTNKKPGRIGDTPTLGAGFWAESWDESEDISSPNEPQSELGPLDLAAEKLGNGLMGWLTGLIHGRSLSPVPQGKRTLLPISEISANPNTSPASPLLQKVSPTRTRRRAVAMSGTGNGDSFLRTCAVRTTAAMCRFSPTSLGQAVSNVAGYDGELQRSAGTRWGVTGEGEGGIIGIEVCGGDENGKSNRQGRKGKLVAEFNCGGMWRAWVDEGSGEVKVMVFKEEYK
jgi:L-asparaginase